MKEKEMVGLNIRVTPELRQRFKLACVETGRTMEQAGQELIEGWLRKRAQIAREKGNDNGD